MAHKRKNKHSKVELVFNPQERQEFLTGFSKRKQARKKAAHADLEKKYKEEVARIKKEKRERIKQKLEEVASVKRANGIELTQLAENELDKEKVLDLPHHVVTITSTEELDLSKSSNGAYLGSNATAVEVVDAVDSEARDSHLDGEIHNNQEVEESDRQSKTAQGKSAARVAALARKAQALKAKKKQRSKIVMNGKMSKAQKKFLKKKHRHKSKPTR